MGMTNIYAEYAWDGLPELLSSEREIYLVYDRAVAGWASGLQKKLGSLHPVSGNTLQGSSEPKVVEVSDREGNTPQDCSEPKGVVLPDGEEKTPQDCSESKGVSCPYGGIELKGVMEVEAGESTKTLAAAMEIVDFLLDHNAGRDALLLAMGGGATTDVAGFAASIYKRGIRFATLPTTLLSQVDAGIGGKTGVNYRGYKNIIGTIRQPEFVWCASCTLETLPPRQFRSGAAEMLKTFIIADAEKYDEAVKCLSANVLSPQIASLAADAGRIKDGIVLRDPYESGERRVLNLGHTIGHALEWLQQKEESPAAVAFRNTQSPDGVSGPVCSLSHGEAVAIGIVAAARLAERLDLAEDGLADRIAGDFQAVGLPTELPVEAVALREAILQDKKAALGKVKFVLPVAIGRVVVKELTIDIITGK